LLLRLRQMSAPDPVTTFEGEEIVFDIIDGLVDRCGEVLYEHYLRKKQIPYATKNCLHDVFESLTTVYLDRDFGSAKPEVDPSWVCEREPAASQLDSWARGVVTLKKKPKPKKVVEEAEEAKPVEVKKKKTRRVGKDLMDEEDDRLNQLIRAGTPGSPRGMGGGARQMTAKEEANLKELHDLEVREAKEKEKRQRIIDDALAEIKRSEKIMKDLKGKEYTFDHEGKVVMVHKAKGDKMKPMQQNVGVAVVNVQKEVVQVEKPKKQGMRRKKKKKKQNPVDPFKDSFQDTAPKQPSIMQDIYLAPGVNIAEGDSNKLGPNQQVIPDHMSRKDYNMLHQTAKETTAMGGGTDGEESFDEAEETEEQAETRRLNPTDIGSVDPMVGAKQGGGGGAPIPADDVNLQLTGDPNWGSNVRTSGEDFQPSPIPVKQDAQKTQLTALMLGGEEVRNVRDRPHIVLSPTANRKKLPAPPLGHSTGHGHSTETFLPSLTGGGGAAQMMVSKSLPFLTVKEKGRGGTMEKSIDNVEELLA
jgi:hypothetical protein